jgi:hypothetical protein
MRRPSAKVLSRIDDVIRSHVQKEDSQNYHHAIAKDEKEAGELIDNGWTYICTTPQNMMMFRKRR